MNIAVLVKLVPDSQAVIKIGDNRKTIATADLAFVMNPYDEYAVEEALKTKEKMGGTVTVFSLGDKDAEKVLRTALAMGADEAVHIEGPGELDMLGVAKALASALKPHGFDLIFAGKASIDDECSAVGPMVAELLEIPHVSAADKVTVEAGKLTAERSIEGGVEVFEASLPALVTAEKGLNEPRYASLKGIMMSKKKNITAVPAEKTEALVEVLDLNYPPSRPAGRIIGKGVEAVPELIRLLKQEAKVL